MYIVAIPSYQRAELLNRKTLKTLSEYNIPRNRIYVFVANKTEEQIYKEKLNKDFYGHLIVGVKGLKNQRNFISRYFPDGKQILNMDDDIGGFNSPFFIEILYQTTSNSQFPLCSSCLTFLING